MDKDASKERIELESDSLISLPSDVRDILDLAERMQSAYERMFLRIQTFRLVQVSLLAIGSAIWYFLYVFSVGTIKAINNQIGIAALAVTFIYSIAIEFAVYRIGRRAQRDQRAILELVNVLRETESVFFSQNRLPALVKAEFRIRMSRFEVGPGHTDEKGIFGLAANLLFGQADRFKRFELKTVDMVSTEKSNLKSSSERFPRNIIFHSINEIYDTIPATLLAAHPALPLNAIKINKALNRSVLGAHIRLKIFVEIKDRCPEGRYLGIPRLKARFAPRNLSLVDCNLWAYLDGEDKRLSHKFLLLNVGDEVEISGSIERADVEGQKRFTLNIDLFDCVFVD